MFKSILARNAACNSIVHLVDVGSDYSSAGIYIYDTTNFPQFFPDDSTTITPITRMAMSYPAFQDATDGTSLARLISDATAFRNGVASGFGIFNMDSTFVFGGTVSGPSPQVLGDMVLNQTVIEQDQTVSLSDGAYYLVP